MTNVVVAVGSLLTLVAVIPYLREIAKGLTKPRLVTWTVWAGIDGVSAAGSFASGQLPAGIFTLACSIECVLIVLLGARRGDRSFERLDFVCSLGALVGLGVLVILKNPTYAVAAAIATDFVGTVPTVKHAWTRPYEETVSTYALYAVGATVLLPTVNFDVFTAFAYPIYICVVDTGIVAMLVGRAKIVQGPPVYVPEHAAGINHSASVVPSAHRLVVWSALKAHPYLQELARDSQIGAPSADWVHKYRVVLAGDVRAAVRLHSYGYSEALARVLTEIAKEADHGSAQLGLMLGDSVVRAPEKAPASAMHYANFVTSCAKEGLANGLVALYARQLAQMEVARALELYVASGTWLHDWATDRASHSFGVRVDTLARHIDGLAPLPSSPDARHLVWIAARVFRFELETIDVADSKKIVVVP